MVLQEHLKCKIKVLHDIPTSRTRSTKHSATDLRFLFTVWEVQFIFFLKLYLLSCKLYYKKICIWLLFFKILNSSIFIYCIIVWLNSSYLNSNFMRTRYNLLKVLIQCLLQKRVWKRIVRNLSPCCSTLTVGNNHAFQSIPKNKIEVTSDNSVKLSSRIIYYLLSSNLGELKFMPKLLCSRFTKDLICQVFNI